MHIEFLFTIFAICLLTKCISNFIIKKSGNSFHLLSNIGNCNKPSYTPIPIMSFKIIYMEDVCRRYYMLIDEINNLREKLNKQVEYFSLDNEAILTLSQILDDLIIEYYKASKKV